MKKFLIPIIFIVALILWGFSVNNKAVSFDEGINEAWSNVETTYQRRNDLIGNLVNTVKGAADFEKSTLEAVINARSNATKMNIDVNDLTPENIEKFKQAQGNLSSALSRLLVTVERYPELKANQNFLKLQDELTSTENTIQTARTRFNEAVRPYNTYVRTMPTSFMANLMGFDQKPYFDAEAGAEKPVNVEFDFK